MLSLSLPNRLQDLTFFFCRCCVSDSLKIDLKTAATAVGLVGSLSGLIASWTLTQYRMDQIEERVSGIETDIEAGDAKIAEQASELRCTICGVHKIPCPGC